MNGSFIQPGLRAGVTALAGMCLCACAVNRHAPRAGELIDLPKQYAAAPVDAMDVRTIAEAVDSPELTELLDLAFGQNLNLKAAWARVSRAEALAGEARAGLFPSVRGGFDAERGTPPVDQSTAPTNARAAPGGASGGASGTRNHFSGSVGAAYEIDLWGRLRGNARAALLDAEAIRRDAKGLSVSLAAEVAEAWAALAASRERRDMLRAQLETSENILELTRLRFEEGLVGAGDVAQQARQTESVRGSMILIEIELRTLENRLTVLIGRVPGQPLPVEQTVLPAPPPVMDPGLPGDLLEKRPDIQAARLRLEGADERTAAAVADRLPRLRLNANIFDQAERVSDLFSDVFWSLAASAEQDLYTGGRRSAAVTGAESAAEAALFAYGQTLLEALREVEDALVLARRQREHVENLRQQLGFAEAAFEAALRRYREGDVDFLSVLITLQTANRVDLELLDARRDLFSSRVQLWRALGGGWHETQETDHGQ